MTVEIERYYGIIVTVGGINTKSPNLPDWNISMLNIHLVKVINE